MKNLHGPLFCGFSGFEHLWIEVTILSEDIGARLEFYFNSLLQGCDSIDSVYFLYACEEALWHWQVLAQLLAPFDPVFNSQAESRCALLFQTQSQKLTIFCSDYATRLLGMDHIFISEIPIVAPNRRRYHCWANRIRFPHDLELGCFCCGISDRVF